MPGIPALRSLKQEDHKFKATLGYRSEIPHLKQTKADSYVQSSDQEGDQILFSKDPHLGGKNSKLANTGNEWQENYFGINKLFLGNYE